MRSQCAVYVDAGYLLAATATRVTGTSLRSGVDVDHRALIECLIRHAEEDSGLPVLRVNWYDSGSRPGGLPDYTQEQIGLTPRFKLRLGRRSLAGEQKGVDLRIGLDLATHGRQRVVDVMYLVTGDDDLTEAVEEAQAHGVQVSLLAVPNHAGRPQAVARHLQRAADEVLLIDGAALDAAVRTRNIPEVLVPRQAADGPEAEATPGDASADIPVLPPALAPPAGEPHADGQPAEHEEEPAEARPKPSVFAGKKPTVVVPPKPTSAVVWSSTVHAAQPWEDTEVTLEDVNHVAQQVVEGWCKVASPAMLAELRAGQPTIPGDLDRALLVDLSSRSGVYDIPDAARYALRERFWALIDKAKVS